MHQQTDVRFPPFAPTPFGADVRVFFDVDGTNLVRSLKLHKRLRKAAKRERGAAAAAAAEATAAAEDDAASASDGDGDGEERAANAGESSNGEDEEGVEEEEAAAAGADGAEGAERPDSEAAEPNGGNGAAAGGSTGGSDDDEDAEEGSDDDNGGSEGGGDPALEPATGARGGQARPPPAGPRAPAPMPTAFDRIVFNFPHRGLGIKDQDANVRCATSRTDLPDRSRTDLAPLPAQRLQHTPITLSLSLPFPSLSPSPPLPPLPSRRSQLNGIAVRTSSFWWASLRARTSSSPRGEKSTSR